MDYNIDVVAEQNSDRTLRALVVTLGAGDRWSVLVRRCWFQREVTQLEVVTHTGVLAFAPEDAAALVRVIDAAHIVVRHMDRHPYDFVECDPDALLQTLLPATPENATRSRHYYAVAFPALGLLESREGCAVVHRFQNRTERDLFVALRPYHRRTGSSTDPFVRRARAEIEEFQIQEWDARTVTVASGHEYFVVTAETGFQYVHRFVTQPARDAFIAERRRERHEVSSSDVRVRKARESAENSGKADWTEMAVR